MKTFQYILIALGIALFLVLAWYLSTIVLYIIISAVLALIGRPLVSYLERIRIRKRRMPSSLAAAITLLTIWAVMITFFVVFIPLVINEGQALSSVNVNQVVENVQEPLQKVEEVYNRYTAGEDTKPLKQIAVER